MLAGWGVEHTAVHLGDLDAVRAAFTPATKVLWCETPSNPLLGISDLAERTLRLALRSPASSGC